MKYARNLICRVAVAAAISLLASAPGLQAAEKYMRAEYYKTEYYSPQSSQARAVTTSRTRSVTPAKTHGTAYLNQSAPSTQTRAQVSSNATGVTQVTTTQNVSRNKTQYVASNTTRTTVRDTSAKQTIAYEPSRTYIPVYDEPICSKWKVSSGVLVRSVNVDFSMKVRASQFSQIGGSKSLYGADGNTQEYNDGKVFFLDRESQALGIAGFKGGKTSQRSVTTSFDTVLPQYKTEFHSASASGESNSVNTESSQAGVSPFIKGEYTVQEFEKGCLNVFGQYAFTHVDRSTSVNGNLNGKSYTFTYDDLPGLNKQFLIFNPAAFDSDGGFSPAPKSPTRKVSKLSSKAKADLDVNLNEFTVGLSFSRQIWDRVHLNASVGPTFNWYDSDFHSQQSLRSGGSTVSTVKTSQSKQVFRMGVLAQVGASIDLDSRKRWTFEIFGTYNWVNPFRASTNQASVSIDPSSFGGGAGFGFKF